ncbi:potassium transporter peripheral membrane protein [Actinobacillus equuli]|nr:potassium transporter peripheral membrane protein [Actinobacillus equuli]
MAHFANELVSLVSVKAYYGGPLVGYPISALRDHLPYIEARIVSIFRQDRAIIPQGSTIIEAGDEVFFICATHNIKAVMSELQRLDKPHKRVMIVGGGSIGTGLAKDLEEQCSVKMIERDPRKAEKLAEKLEKALVLCGDASDQELLFEEHIENIDLFLALTSDDEANIMSALLAKRLGAKKAIVLVQKMAYLHLIQGGTIDIALSPKQATISALSSHVRKGDIVQVASLNKGRRNVSKLLRTVMRNRLKWLGAPYEN